MGVFVDATEAPAVFVGAAVLVGRGVLVGGGVFVGAGVFVGGVSVFVAVGSAPRRCAHRKLSLFDVLRVFSIRIVLALEGTSDVARSNDAGLVVPTGYAWLPPDTGTNWGFPGTW